MPQKSSANYGERLATIAESGELPEEYFEKEKRVNDMEKRGTATPEQASRIRRGMRIMYAIRRARERGDI